MTQLILFLLQEFYTSINLRISNTFRKYNIDYQTKCQHNAQQKNFQIATFHSLTTIQSHNSPSCSRTDYAVSYTAIQSTQILTSNHRIQMTHRLDLFLVGVKASPKSIHHSRDLVSPTPPRLPPKKGQMHYSRRGEITLKNAFPRVLYRSRGAPLGGSTWRLRAGEESTRVKVANNNDCDDNERGGLRCSAFFPVLSIMLRRRVYRAFLRYVLVFSVGDFSV